MTPQEKELLERFLSEMAAARAGQKDTEAEALIREAVSRQPDAAYLLVQRAIQLDQALQLTQAEAARLRAEADRAKSGASAGAGGGFLNDSYAWGSQAKPAAPQPASARPGVLSAAPSQQPAGRQAAGGGWGGGGMLGTVATTAAGVVAGSFLFQGIQSLMNRNDPAEAAKAEPTHSAEQTPAPLAHEDNAFEEPNDTYAAGDDGGGDFA